MASIATSAEWRRHWLAAYTARRNLVKRLGSESDAVDYANDVIAQLDSDFAAEANLSSVENREAYITNVIAMTLAPRGLGLAVAAVASLAVLQAMLDAGGTNDDTEVPGGIPVNPGAPVTRYVDLAGSDGDSGESGSPWLTRQHALDQLPEGFDGDFILFHGPGDFTDDAELKVRVGPNARICMVADSATGFDISGHAFAFVDNATASAVVPDFGSSFGRGERWLRPGAFPVDDVAGFGTPDWGGTTLEASIGTTTLVGVMGDPSVGNACNRVCEYTTQMTCAYFGTKQHGVNLQLVGFDFGGGEMTREGCLFFGCKHTANTNQKNLIGSGGFYTVMGGGNFFGAQVTNLAPNSWSQFMGSYENPLLVRNNVSSVVSTTAVGALSALPALLTAAANATVSQNFCEIRSGVGLSAQANSRAFVTGNVNYNGSRVAEADQNSSIEFVGGGYGGTVSGTGVEAQEHSRIDGTAALNGAVTAATEAIAGTTSTTFAVGGVDIGVAMSAVAP